MSADHKRPLFAFTVVALLCALFVGNALRSEAVVSMLRAVESTTSAVAPELLGRDRTAPDRSGEAAAKPRAARAAAPRVDASAPSAGAVVERSGRVEKAKPTVTRLRAVKDQPAPAADGTPTEVVDVPAPQDVTPVADTPRRVWPVVRPRVESPRAVTPRNQTPRVVTPRAVTPRTAPGRPTWAGPKARQERPAPKAVTPARRWVAPAPARRVQPSVASRPRVTAPRISVPRVTVPQRAATVRTGPSFTRQSDAGRTAFVQSRSQRPDAAPGRGLALGHRR